MLCFVISDPPENTKLTTTANTSATLRNSNVTFTCTSEGNPPPHEYRFYHEGTFLGNSSSGTFQTQVTESGIYSCVPVNKVGEGEKGSVTINVVGKWSVSCATYLLEILDTNVPRGHFFPFCHSVLLSKTFTACLSLIPFFAYL